MPTSPSSHSPPSKQDIAKLKALCAKLTPGPWMVVSGFGAIRLVTDANDAGTQDDLLFIEAAREWLPVLLEHWKGE